mmetsp:Transcript_31217/g.56054  ORF Transcript_31217/g.56054 Transcript_31217/m.56054 type:complete len:267 (-) Transcript_31217:1144-1944(-)
MPVNPMRLYRTFKRSVRSEGASLNPLASACAPSSPTRFPLSCRSSVWSGGALASMARASALRGPRRLSPRFRLSVCSDGASLSVARAWAPRNPNPAPLRFRLSVCSLGASPSLASSRATSHPKSLFQFDAAISRRSTRSEGAFLSRPSSRAAAGPIAPSPPSHLVTFCPKAMVSECRAGVSRSVARARAIPSPSASPKPLEQRSKPSVRREEEFRSPARAWAPSGPNSVKPRSRLRVRSWGASLSVARAWAHSGLSRLWLRFRLSV